VYMCRYNFVAVWLIDSATKLVYVGPIFGCVIHLNV